MQPGSGRSRRPDEGERQAGHGGEGGDGGLPGDGDQRWRRWLGMGYVVRLVERTSSLNISPQSPQVKRAWNS